MPQCALEHELYKLDVKWFVNKVERTKLQSAGEHLFVAEAGYEDNWHVRIHLARLLEKLQAIHVGHADIAEDDVRLFCTELLQTFLTVGLEPSGGRRNTSTAVFTPA